MSLHNVTPGANAPHEFNVIIEIPMNADPIKYEVDHDTGAIFVDRFMSTAMHYPCNYGYIPNTLSDDGDPVDVLVVTPVPLIPGVVVVCRPLGVLKMDDEAGGDNKLLAVPVPRALTLYSNWNKPEDCYTLTYAAHHSTPYLSRDFFARMQRTMARHWVMFVAERGGRRIGCSLIAIDPDRGHAWGRYWGCTEYVPCLHFEACYYQPLAWCIAQGYQRFEGGAQGEHKMARGLLPVLTHSAHWLEHPAFADAVARHLQREGSGMHAYVDELRERNPFRPPATAAS